MSMQNKVARITTSSTLTAKNLPVEILAKTKQTKYCEKQKRLYTLEKAKPNRI